LQIIFLGTSAGKPTKKRNVSAIALKEENSKEWFLFDCGEATQHQILKIDLLTLSTLKYVFITHLHGDHIYGIFGLLASRSMIENAKKLTIFGPKNIKNLLKSVFKYTQLNLSFELEIVEIEEEKEYKIENFTIFIKKLSHSIDSFAFILKEDDKKGNLDVKKLIEDGIFPGPIYSEIKNNRFVTIEGKTIDTTKYLKKPKKGRVIIIAGDNDKPQILFDIAKKFESIDVMIHEATYTQEVYDNLKIDIKHSTAKNVAIAASKMGVKNLILTHFSSRYTTSSKKSSKHNIDEIYQEAKKYFKNRLFLANDFDIYELDLEKRELILKNINLA